MKEKNKYLLAKKVLKYDVDPDGYITDKAVYMVDWYPDESLETVFHIYDALIKNGFCPQLMYDEIGQRFALATEFTSWKDEDCDIHFTTIIPEKRWKKTIAKAICYIALRFAKDGEFDEQSDN
jgi:hypothetical protein